MRTLFSIIILGGVIWFAIGNAEAVTLKLFLWEYSVSLALIVGVCFLLGFIIGLLRLAPGLWSKGSSAKQANKKLMQMEIEREELKKRIKELEQVEETTPQTEVS